MALYGKTGSLLLLLLFVQLSLSAQTGAGNSADTTHPDFLSRMRKMGKAETISSIDKYKTGRITVRQGQLLQEIKYTSQKAKLFLEKGIDTAAYRTYLAATRANLDLTEKAVFVSRDTVQTQRNLAVTAAILDELLNRTNSRRSVLTSHISILEGFIDRIDSLSTDSALYTFPLDSAHTMQYLRRIAVVVKELGPTDTALRRTTAYLQELQTDVDLMVFTLHSHLEEVEKFSSQLETKTFSQELPYLWQPAVVNQSPGDIVRLSLAKETLALGFYFNEHMGRVFILLLLMLASWFFLYSLKQQIKEQNLSDTALHGHLALRYPPLTAIIIVFNIFQFIFLHPPYIVGFCIWLITAICLAILFRGHVAVFWLRFWLIVILLFTLAALNNMILGAFPAERWFMLVLSLAGMLFGIFILRSKHRATLKEKKILYFVGFMVILEAAAVCSNAMGRYNLSKTLMVVGFTGAVIAILFLWTVRLINGTLAVVANVYKHPDKKLFYIDFDRIGDRVPGFFYVFLVLGWVILVSRNFYGFRKLAKPFLEFLTTERTLGNYAFTINSLFIFLLIIVVSSIVSQVISFFAGEPGDQRSKDKKARKPGIGSWLLLIRIFVLSLGVFLAFAAAGIPLDKLAIVLGALGVGIGLGLQGLVSNLVSGLIIAFEKPVNVGDIIEVNGRTGTMKSIGFRSSVVKLTDGAHLVIPNGDLLNNHLLNWTMGQNKRQLNIVIGVAYGSNLKQVKALLEKMLQEHDKVLQYPEPVVAARAFQESSVDFDLYYWINMRDFFSAKDEIITLIHETFQQEGIVIPFPQQDLHIIRDQPPSKDE